ncbi:MAG: hypothetical protein WC788_08030 [Candidatus Paceibacterota bacterium]|jgi:hypothetical protein
MKERIGKWIRETDLTPVIFIVLYFLLLIWLTPSNEPHPADRINAMTEEERSLYFKEQELYDSREQWCGPGGSSC